MNQPAESLQQHIFTVGYIDHASNHWLQADMAKDFLFAERFSFHRCWLVGLQREIV